MNTTDFNFNTKFELQYPYITPFYVFIFLISHFSFATIYLLFFKKGIY
jgi:hypothetical protein